jgi:hypothetical protein
MTSSTPQPTPPRHWDNYGERSFRQGPNLFIGVELRSIGGKVLDMQAAMLSQQWLERCSLVSGAIVHNHDHLAPQVAQQLAPKQANLFLPDIVEIKLIVQTQALAAGTYGDSRND